MAFRVPTLVGLFSCKRKSPTEVGTLNTGRSIADLTLVAGDDRLCSNSDPFSYHLRVHYLSINRPLPQAVLTWKPNAIGCYLTRRG